MGGREGYSYRYRLSMEEEIVPLYNIRALNTKKSFLFELRTNFIVKKRPDEGGAEEVMDSDRFEACVVDDGFGEISMFFRLKTSVEFRLNEYWMPEDEADRLLQDAAAAADQLADYPENASLRIIPIVIGLDVYTVQKEGELLSATMERAIRAEYLVSLRIWHQPTYAKHKYRNHVLIEYLKDLFRFRVEDVDRGLARMQACPICLRSPTIGALISVLRCGHAFHYHCLVRWLGTSQVCFVCQSQVHHYPPNLHDL